MMTGTKRWYRIAYGCSELAQHCGVTYQLLTDDERADAAEPEQPGFCTFCYAPRVEEVTAEEAAEWQRQRGL